MKAVQHIDRQKLIKQLFVAKVSEIIGFEKAIELLKESTVAIDTHILSSLLTKKQDINMKEENENQQDTDKHLLDKLSVGDVGRSFTPEEIKQHAKDFCDKWLPKWEKYCDVCKGCNCKNNNTCIHCGCQF
jgi:uncharacterized membrane protein